VGKWLFKFVPEPQWGPGAKPLVGVSGGDASEADEILANKTVSLL